MSHPSIRKGRKYDQVLEGARTVFMRDGFEGANVDDIARVAGVSKATLYSYFPDKKLLFMETARKECLQQANEAVEIFDVDAPVEQVLLGAGQRIVSFITSEFGRRMFRICVAECERFPTLGHQFYESGPRLLRDRLSAYLRHASEKGELVIEDFDLAAEQFAELCKADLHARILFGIEECCPNRDGKRAVDGAVEMFLARYGAGTASAQKAGQKAAVSL
ncbi:TetR/AcrR family transcriptional regulator [Phaeovulum sp. W22_SRMD_FR3]|uniref:TetR/AcrR family transcriptional regulator n=1 Tax=Phaeovulum sp. W22_SRMD_FR3 TaxID=3240274 RepID=UPI003F964662